MYIVGDTGAWIEESLNWGGYCERHDNGNGCRCSSLCGFENRAASLTRSSICPDLNFLVPVRLGGRCRVTFRSFSVRGYAKDLCNLCKRSCKRSLQKIFARDLCKRSLREIFAKDLCKRSLQEIFAKDLFFFELTDTYYSAVYSN